MVSRSGHDRSKESPPLDDELLTATFAALADPTRRAILARLAQGEATVNELAEPFPMSVQAVSKHLKVLERAGLITRGRDAQWRPCRLEPAGLDGAADWLAGQRETWSGRLDRLEQHLRTMQGPNRDGAQTRRRSTHQQEQEP
jgi:DNA-binding transcriptional ArsR family regulator